MDNSSLRRFSPGDIIITQGDEGDCAYLIEEGQVEIAIDQPDGSRQTIATRGPGTIIGEMAIIDNHRRSANVIAQTNCVLIEVSRDEFNRRLHTADPVVRMIMLVILTRYRDLLVKSNQPGLPPVYPAPEEAERAGLSSQKAVETLRISNEFKHALANNHLKLHLQPVINLPDRKVEGFEALMRWQHPEKGLISPGVFIPVAEDSGLITEATRWAISEAARILLALKKTRKDAEDWFVGVNVSGMDLGQPEFADRIARQVRATGLSPSHIKLEITEYMLIERPERARQTIEECRACGFRIALDDFGTGYSSLSYLHRFPIDTMKIDRSFVADMLDDTGRMTLVRAIVNLAHDLGMNVIAEGVENEGQAGALAALGCNYAQGFLYSPALSEDNLSIWLSRHK